MAEEKKSNAMSVKVSYFGFHGRGAPLLAALSMAGISYQHEFVDIKQHFHDQKQGKRRWYGLPEMTLYDKDGQQLIIISQSNACLRYIGKITGLYPTNPLLAALCDEILDSCEDILWELNKLGTGFMSDQNEIKRLRLTLHEKDKLPYWYNKFELRLKENEERGNKNGFIVGDKMTIADLKLYYGLYMYICGRIDYIDGNKLLSECQRLKKFYEMMQNIKGFKEFNDNFANQVDTYKNENVKCFKFDGKFVSASF